MRIINFDFINKLQSKNLKQPSQQQRIPKTQFLKQSELKLQIPYFSLILNQMLTSSWSIKLSQQPLYATIINQPSPSIIFQGISNQLIASTSTNSIPLPIRKQILQLQSLPTGEVLLLTRYNLICYDLANNNQLFIKQFENAQKLYVSTRYIYVISGSDLTCFTFQGEQEYVSHLGNNIVAIQAYVATAGQQVLIALDDMSMKRYKGVNVVFDYSKVVGVVNTICWVDGGAMIGTQQGTIAYYESKKSKWKAKSTHPTYKIMNWRQNEKDYILVIRKNSTIQIRDHKKGQTVNKIKIGEPFVSIHLSDFRSQGFIQLICICKSAAVKAFNLQQQQLKIQQKNKVGQQIQDQIKKTDQLLKQKAQLEYDISQLQELCNKTDQNQINNAHQEDTLSSDFKIQVSLKYEKGLNVIINCTNGFISGLSFQQAIMPFRIQRSEKMIYLFRNENKIAGQIGCQALCHSSFSSKTYEIKSFKIHLSKFWHWGFVTQRKVDKQIEGFVKFDLIQRNARYIKWMQQCFYFNANQQTLSKLQGMSILNVRFYNHYENQEMEMTFKAKQGKVQIKCDSIQVLGEVIQDLMQYVGAKELDSVLTFPLKQKQKLRDVLTTIQKLSQTKVSINSQMAQAVNNIKFMLVKGQSSLAVGNLDDLRKSYNQIMTQNKNIVLQLQKKNANTTNLADSMKTLGRLINQTSNVRYGKAKQTIINNCRQAIKKKDFPKIMAIMQRGMGAISS